MKSVFFAAAVVLFGLAGSGAFCGVKSKYGPQATRLSDAHEYVRTNRAPDFWALMPYYIGQQDERSCSVASVTMVVNAARVARSLSSDEELATQSALLARTKDEKWAKDVGAFGHGVTLDELGPFVKEALEAYGVKDYEVETIHADNLSKPTQDKLHAVLVQNEKSAVDFLIVNFIQGVYTGDADAGHIAPVAAYDAKRKRVLVLDPDRQWYEPYWVSEETLLKGMATQDKVSEKSRGYLWIKPRK